MSKKAYWAAIRTRDGTKDVGPLRASRRTALRDAEKHNKKNGYIYAASAYIIYGMERGDYALSEL